MECRALKTWRLSLGGTKRKERKNKSLLLSGNSVEGTTPGLRDCKAPFVIAFPTAFLARGVNNVHTEERETSRALMTKCIHRESELRM